MKSLNLRFILTYFLLTIHLFGKAQNDTLYFHNQIIAPVTVLKVDAFNISFKYIGEESEQVVSNYAIQKIKYKSGRTAVLSQKIEVNTEADWEKVVILFDNTQTAGLNRKADIIENTAFFNLHTASTAYKKVLMKILKKAAAQHCPFVLFTADQQVKYNGISGGWGALQNIRAGIAFSY